MRDPSGRRPTDHTVFLLAGSMAVTGSSLAVAGLVAGAIFKRGSLGAALLVLAVVMSAAVSAGYLLRPVAIRRLQVIRSNSADQRCQPAPDSQHEYVPRQSRLRERLRAMTMGATVPPAPSKRALHK